MLNIPKATTAANRDRSPIPRIVRSGGSVAAGLLIAFSMPPWGWWPLAFVGIAVFDQLLAGATRRQRFWTGFSTGICWLFPAMLWMWGLTPPGYIIAGVLFSVFYGLAAMAVPPGRSRRLALPAVLVFAGFARWSVPFGGVPVATLAMSQSDAPLLATARVFGSLLIVALVAVAGVGLSALADRDWRASSVAAAVIVLSLVLAAIAPSGTPIDTIDVAIVQGGGPQNTRAITSDARKVFERHLAASELVSTPVDIVLWPENVIDVEGDLRDNPEFGEIVELAQRLDAPIIIGATEGFRDPEPYYTNASMVVTPEGEITSRYDKVQRVPYGEYVPFRSLVEPFAPAALTSRDARPGDGPAILETGFGTFGISISWEIFFDRRARDAMNNGGQILVNPTNGSSYWLTILQTQQVASSKLRAVETGRYVLQAAPTGFSAIIEPDGTVIDRSGVSEAKVIQGTVELRTGRTWAVRLGPFPMLLVAAFALAGAWNFSRRRGVDGS